MKASGKASAVLVAMGELFRASQVGRCGGQTEDFIVDFRRLLKTANAEDGEERELAVQHLPEVTAASQGLLRLDCHARDSKIILRVRLASKGGEEWLFQQLGESTPTREREDLAALFHPQGSALRVPEEWEDRWVGWCEEKARMALCGGNLAPFLARDREDEIRELLVVVSRLLAWKGTSLLRFASCLVCGNSKRLGDLRSAVETCLRQVSAGKIDSLAALGIEDKPREVHVCGPLRLVFADGVLDLGLLRAPVAISETDLHRTIAIECGTDRVLTVENETSFLELAKVARDALLIQTSYPGRATLALLAKLPKAVTFHHFGDTDPAGFDILRDLRERSGLPLEPLHMELRPKEGGKDLTKQDHEILGRLLNHPLMEDCSALLREMQVGGRLGEFEQETLGQPNLRQWPHYD